MATAEGVLQREYCRGGLLQRGATAEGGYCRGGLLQKQREEVTAVAPGTVPDPPRWLYLWNSPRGGLYICSTADAEVEMETPFSFNKKGI